MARQNLNRIEIDPAVCTQRGAAVEAMTVKKTKSRELVLTVGDGYVEVAERHYGKYLDRATYGVTLRGNVVEMWKEDEGGHRTVVRTETLTDDEAEWVKNCKVKHGKSPHQCAKKGELFDVSMAVLYVR